MADSDTPALEAASKAIEDWCRANPAEFEPVAPSAGFEPVPERVTVSYLTSKITPSGGPPDLWIMKRSTDG